MLLFFIFKAAISFGLSITIPKIRKTENFDDISSNALLENRDLGRCSCDVTDQCDENCCCDPDCPFQLFNFTKCLPALPNIKESEGKALRKCSDPQIEGDGSLLDWIQRTMLCIYQDNNPSLGKFYKLKTSHNENEYADSESSLSNAFQTYQEQSELQPLISSIDIKNINLIEYDSDFTLFNYLNQQCIEDYNISEEENLLNSENDTCSSLRKERTRERTIFDPIIYQENVQRLYEVNWTRNFTSIDVSNITCTNSTNCTANLSKEESNQTQTQVLVTYRWQNNKGVNEDRGYYFSEELRNATGEPITVKGPSRGNRCAEDNIPLRFGMNLDFTCFTEIPIGNFNIKDGEPIDLNDHPEDFGFDFERMRQVPFSDSDPIKIDEGNATFDTSQYNYTDKCNAHDGNETDCVPSLFITDVTRTIDIFYKTIGYEKNPTHIIKNIYINYNFSSSILYIAFPPNDDCQNVALRTVVRFYEYPNNINMFKGTSTNSKLQSWLPFEV